MIGTEGVLKGVEFLYVVCMIDEHTIYWHYATVLPASSERGLQLSVAEQAITVGRGGVTAVSQVTRPRQHLYERSISEAILQAMEGR